MTDEIRWPTPQEVFNTAKKLIRGGDSGDTPNTEPEMSIRFITESLRALAYVSAWAICFHMEQNYDWADYESEGEESE